MCIKEIKDGIGNVKDRKRGLSTFIRTTRDYEVNLSLPNNGPSPHPNKFSPSFKFIHS